MDTVYQKYEKDFYEYPAATKNHHDFVGGLATHVLGMLRLAVFVARQYPVLNRDLLISGVFLHDLGKLQGAERSHCAKLYDTGKTVGAYLDVSGGNYENSISAQALKKKKKLRWFDI